MGVFVFHVITSYSIHYTKLYDAYRVIGSLTCTLQGWCDECFCACPASSCVFCAVYGEKVLHYLFAHLALCDYCYLLLGTFLVARNDGRFMTKDAAWDSGILFCSCICELIIS